MHIDCFAYKHKYNQSGCADPTAYKALRKVIKEEKELDKRVHNLINVLKFIIDWAGFELIKGDYSSPGCRRRC